MSETKRERTLRLAQEFHAAYERLAPEFGYKTREETAVPWEQVPKQNVDLMVAVIEEVMLPAISLARAEAFEEAKLAVKDSFDEEEALANIDALKEITDAK